MNLVSSGISALMVSEMFLASFGDVPITVGSPLRIANFRSKAFCVSSRL